MVINSLIKKSLLAVLIAYGSVVWLTVWHQFGYGTRMSFPPISSWPRDTMIILPSVMLAVFAGLALAQRLIRRSQGHISPWLQSMLTASLLGGLTTLSIILMEANRIFQTGIGNEVAIQVTVCRKIVPASSLILKTLLGIFPGPQAMRYHVLLQDGIYLALVNLGITIVLILFLEGFVKRESNSYHLETA